jgi:sporulation protein YlmC with PRC-barrel domain
MSAPNSVGSTVTQSTLFNSGILTINAVQIGDLEDITVTQDKTIKDYYALGSIKKRKIRAANLNQSISFTVKGGVYRKLVEAFYGSSAATGSGTLYTVIDGQPAIPTMYITAYQDDDTTKSYQLTVSNPVVMKLPISLKTQDFAGITVDFACTEVTMYVDTAVAN